MMLSDGKRGLAAGERSEESAVGSVERPTRPTSASPAAKPRPRSAQHHINHMGNPCKVCGWPETKEQ